MPSRILKLLLLAALLTGPSSVMDARDQTFREAGKVGVWTKANSITYFDDLSVAPL